MDKNNNDSKNNQKVKEVILSEETLRELDSLNERIDSLTVKSDIKFGRVCCSLKIGQKIEQI